MGVTELVNAAPSATGAPTGVVATDDERYNAALIRRVDQHEDLAYFWVKFDGDPTPFDDVKGGTCAGAGSLNEGDPCDVDGVSTPFGGVSYDCLPDPLDNIGGLQIELNLTDDAVNQLAQIRSLEDLDISDTWISASGAAKLQSLLPHCRIVR